MSRARRLARRPARGLVAWLVMWLAVWLAGCGGEPAPAARGDAGAASERDEVAQAKGSLRFTRDGALVVELSMAELVRSIAPETVTMSDPYYGKTKTFRAIPLTAVLTRAFGALTGLEGRELVLRASDGYAVPMTLARATEGGAYLAFRDVDVPAWEPIGPQRANPGPIYLVWAGPEQQRLETHPRPWQLASVEATRFEAVYPHVVPTGAPASSPEMRGLELWKRTCLACHAINREGGRVGPELNVPQNIFEYRPEEQVRAYIKNPRVFRYGNMPSHEHLSDGDLDALVAYLRAMRAHKHDPEASSAK